MITRTCDGRPLSNLSLAHKTPKCSLLSYCGPHGAARSPHDTVAVGKPPKIPRRSLRIVMIVRPCKGRDNRAFGKPESSSSGIASVDAAVFPKDSLDGHAHVRVGGHAGPRAMRRHGFATDRSSARSFFQRFKPGLIGLSVPTYQDEKAARTRRLYAP